MSIDQESKLFKPEPQYAVIYIYRNQFQGGAQTASIIFDEKVLGQTRNGHYLRVLAKPGTHVIASQTRFTEYLELKTEANKIYYIWQNLKFFDERVYLNPVDENTGKSGVMECELIRHQQPE